MGGCGSGRQNGKATVDSSLGIDLAWLLRTKRAEEGAWRSGYLSWFCGSDEVGSIGY